jgi:hypothetical protein
VQRRLDAVADDDEGRIGNVQVRIDAKRCGEERSVAVAGGVAVEEVAVVENADGAGLGDRLRRLMDRKVVTLAQRQRRMSP